MERTPAEPRRGGGRNEPPVDDDADDEEEAHPRRPPARGGDGGIADRERRRPPFSTVNVAPAPAAARRGGGSVGGGVPSSPCCQAEMCAADLTEAKRYHRRHKVCEAHSKAPAVIVAGVHQRFCQQCSRFHELSEFDEAKRSCRRRLAGHNERRRNIRIVKSVASHFSMAS